MKYLQHPDTLQILPEGDHASALIKAGYKPVDVTHLKKPATGQVVVITTSDYKKWGASEKEGWVKIGSPDQEDAKIFAAAFNTAEEPVQEPLIPEIVKEN